MEVVSIGASEKSLKEPIRPERPARVDPKGAQLRGERAARKAARMAGVPSEQAGPQRGEAFSRSVREMLSGMPGVPPSVGGGGVTFNGPA